MKKFTNLCFLGLFYLFSIGFANAQCTSIDQLTANSGTGAMINSTTIVGQSFKACRDGQIETIKVKVNFMNAAPLTTELRIASGSKTSTNVLHSQTVTINEMGEVEFSLNQPVIVENGKQYAFSLGGSGDALNINYSSSLGDTYMDGDLFLNTNTITTADLFFSIGFGATPIPETVVLSTVPTMSQWGTFIFGLLILNLGVFFIQERKLAYSTH